MKVASRCDSGLTQSLTNRKRRFDGLAPQAKSCQSEPYINKWRCAILVLSRKKSERILIGDEIAITIVRIGPNSVRIGIDAPKTMNIVREELKAEPVDALKHDVD